MAYRVEDCWPRCCRVREIGPPGQYTPPPPPVLPSIYAPEPAYRQDVLNRLPEEQRERELQRPAKSKKKGNCGGCASGKNKPSAAPPLLSATGSSPPLTLGRPCCFSKTLAKYEQFEALLASRGVSAQFRSPRNRKAPGKCCRPAAQRFGRNYRGRIYRSGGGRFCRRCGRSRYAVRDSCG